MENEAGAATAAPIGPDVRVCPDCGSAAGAQPFCASCGRNLSLIERLPTRDEWERDGASAPPAAPQEVALPTAIAEALGSIQAWHVPLDGAASSTDTRAIDRLKLSVQDHVSSALERGGHEGLRVETVSSEAGAETIYVTASVSLSHEQSMEQQFGVAIQRMRGQAHVRPLGTIDLVGVDGDVIQSFAAEQGGQSGPGPDRGDNQRFLIGAYVSAVLIPVVGILVALYTAVSEQKAAVRRHAIGIAGVSLLVIAVYVIVVTSINSSHQDHNVASDLRSLLDSNGIQYDNVGDCAHQSGNQYVCLVTQNGQQISVQVTDDGHTIYEQGISANGG